MVVCQCRVKTANEVNRKEGRRKNGSLQECDFVLTGLRNNFPFRTNLSLCHFELRYTILVLLIKMRSGSYFVGGWIFRIVVVMNLIQEFPRNWQ